MAHRSSLCLPVVLNFAANLRVYLMLFFDNALDVFCEASNTPPIYSPVRDK